MTPKNVYVKFDPETGKWLVLEMTPLESYVDDVERYGADIANENQRALDMRQRGHTAVYEVQE